MKYSLAFTMALACLFGAVPFAGAQNNEKPLKDVLAELLPGMGAEKVGDRNGPQQQWQDICFKAGSPGSEAKRLEVCKLMAEKLGPEVAAPARVWLLKELMVIGRAECVDGIAAALADGDELVRDAACRAMANNPAPEATAKLTARLAAAQGPEKRRVMIALGYRSDKAAVDALAKELSGDQAAAAADALGHIATPEAAKALADAQGKAPADARMALALARLGCADRMVLDGKLQDAAAIYKDVNKPEQARGVRLSAMVGTVKSAGDKTGTLLVEMLASQDADTRAIAAGQLGTVPVAAIKTVLESLDKLPAASQCLVIAGVASRGDKSLVSVAQKAIQSENEAVKLTGIIALGRMGDAGQVGALVELLPVGGPVGEAARDSLCILSGAGVHEAIVAALKAEKDNGRKHRFIEVCEHRRTAAAVPVLFEICMGEDSGLRGRAISALAQLAEPKDASELIKVLLKADKGGQRDEAERAIFNVLSQNTDEDHRGDEVLAICGRANQADRNAILPLVGRLGGAKAMEAIKAALDSSDTETYESGVRALCNWPTVEVADDLCKLAQTAKKDNQKIWALRGLIRVSALPSDRPNVEKLAMLKTAMGLATRREERDMILERMASVREVETLRVVVPYLDDQELCQRACRTVIELAHHKDLRQKSLDEFNNALDKVLRLSKDNWVLDQAKKYREGKTG